MTKTAKSKDYVAAWKSLLSTKRLRKTRVKHRSNLDARTKFENDFDRVIFSSSFRRLRNKAQVFSLDPHDFVRTRLTHSVEVSTIGRSLGKGAAKGLALKHREFNSLPGFARDVPTIVATACLLHDIGNPPFGHSGERAISMWFDHKIKAEQFVMRGEQERLDMTQFEGNAQAWRVATRLQWTGDDFGMNLTVATLSALIKYPCASHQVETRGPQPLKKFGYFKSDNSTFDEIRSLSGLDSFCRNPLTYLTEAADDIAYATGDIEDALKKGFVDYETVRGSLAVVEGESKVCVEEYLNKPYNQDFKKLEPKERQQLSTQRFCQMARLQMTKSAIQAFLDNFDEIMKGSFPQDLVQAMSMSDLCHTLKTFMKKYVHSHVEIAHREQTAREVIGGLLRSIVEELQQRPDETLAKATYGEPPRHPHEDPSDLSDNYRIAQRATDYISGMTDGYALAQYQRIFGMRALV